jgi:parallel beta-helix repeat protein
MSLTTVKGSVLNRGVNVKDYGAVGDGVTDDTAAIQAAINAAELNNGGVVFFGSSTYRCDSSLTIDSDGVILELAGGTLDFTNLPITTTSATPAVGLYVSGLAGSDVLVSADINAKDRQITVASTTGISAGDVLLIKSTQLYMDGASGTEKREEIGVVESVDSGTTLTFENMIKFSYATASTAEITPLTMVNDVQVKNGTILMGGVGSGHDGIKANYASGFLIENCTVKKGENTNIWVRYSKDAQIKNCKIEEATDPSFINTGYGVLFSHSSVNCVVQRCSFLNNRHHVAGGTMACDIRVLNNYCGQSSDAALDCHEPCFWWKFSENFIDGNNSTGIGLRGQFCEVTNNTIKNSSSGIAIYIHSYDTNPAGQRRIVVTGNRIENCRQGIIFDGTTAEIFDSLCSGNHVRNCELSHIQLSKTKNSVFDGNIIETTVDTATSGSGLRLVGSVLGDCQGIVVSNNHISNCQYHGIWVDYAQRCSFSNNYVSDTVRNSILVEQSEEIQVIGGFFEPGSNNPQAIYLLNSNNVQINGVNCKYDGVTATRDGIYVSGCNDVVVANSIIDGMTRYGLFATGSTFVSSSNNNAHTCATPFTGVNESDIKSDTNTGTNTTANGTLSVTINGTNYVLLTAATLS